MSLNPGDNVCLPDTNIDLCTWITNFEIYLPVVERQQMRGAGYSLLNTRTKLPDFQGNRK